MDTLLLSRADVLEELPEFDRELLYDYRHRGELRAFRPGPSEWAFYFAADVARIQSGRRDWRPAWWGTIIVAELTIEEFCQRTGIGSHACYEAIGCGRICAARRPGPGRGGFAWRVPRRELEKFV